MMNGALNKILFVDLAIEPTGMHATSIIMRFNRNTGTSAQTCKYPVKRTLPNAHIEDERSNLSYASDLVLVPELVV